MESAKDDEGPSQTTAKKKRPDGEEDAERDKLDRAISYRLKWWQIMLTFIGGVAAAVLTGVAPAWIQADVRNQVYEATYEDKKRVLQLMEEYQKKLDELRAERDKVADMEKRLREREAELEAVRADADRMVANLRDRYRALELAERKRQAERRALTAKAARVKPWEKHGCWIETVTERRGDAVCDRGHRAVFAENTPDEKVIVEPSRNCGKHSWSEWDVGRKKCEQYAHSFFATKGLSRDDAEDILLRYNLSRVFSGDKKSGTKPKRGGMADFFGAKPIEVK